MSAFTSSGEEAEVERAESEGLRGCDGAAIRDGRDRLVSPTFVLIVVCAFCAYVVAQGLNSGTTVYLDGIGFPAMYAGIVGAAFSVSAGIGRILSGPFVDAHGRMIVSIAGSCMLVVGTAAPLFLDGMAPLVVARVVQGIGFSSVATATATAAVDVLPESRLGEGVGYYGLAQSFAFAVGPALALFLVSLEPSSSMFAGISVSAALALVFSLLVRYERDPRHLPQKAAYLLRFQKGEVPYIKSSDLRGDLAQDRNCCEPCGESDCVGADEGAAAGEKAARLRSFWRRFLDSSFDKHALPGAIPMFVLSPVYGFAIFFLGLYGGSIGIGNPGLFFTVAAVTMVVSRAASGRFMDNTPPFYLYTVATACGIIAYLMVMGASEWIPLYYLAGIPYGVSIGLALPVLSTVAVGNTEAKHWGVANAMVGVAMDVGIGISIIVWGALSDSFGFTVTLLLVIALFVVSLFVARKMFSQIGR